jgi:hypothetical protein
MRYPKLTISIVLIACCTVSVLLRAVYLPPSSDRSGSSSQAVVVANHYTNDRYEYSVTIPEGYWLAEDIMAASNDNETANAADYVVVTNLPPTQEQFVAAQIRKLDPQTNLVPLQAILTGNDFVISPAVTDLGFDFAQHFAGLAAPGTSIPIVENLATDTLDNGKGAVRYSLAIIDNPAMRLETEFIPISSSSYQQRLATTSIQGFLIQSLEDASFSGAAFTTFYKSFDLSR